MQKTFTLILFCMLICSVFTVFLPVETCNATNGNTLYVGGDGSGNYTKIQEAIDNATDGDTVYVYAGTYYGCIIVNKSINLIGGNKYDTVIDGNFTGNVVNVSADKVTLAGFIIQNSGSFNFIAGIHVLSNYSNITDNIIKNCKVGILSSYSSNNITENIIKNSTLGIYLGASSYNNIIGNNITNNVKGIYLEFSSNNKINKNTITNNWGALLFDTSSDNNTVNENDIMNNDVVGVQLYKSSYNSITGNNFTNNNCSIFLGSSSNTISSNIITNNNIGINVSADSNNNHISGNIFSNNGADIKDETKTSEDKTPGFELILVVCVIALVLFWKRKSNS